ncbi:hypothetical protein PRIPAC_95090, partial [Pristionchus pacificus]
SDEFTLASLPSDIIRTIVSVDPRKRRLGNMRLISKTWNLLAVAQIKSLPNIEMLTFNLQENYLRVLIHVNKNYKSFFEKIDSNCWTRDDEKETHVLIIFDIRLDINDLSRILDYTNHIEILVVRGFNQRAFFMLSNVKGNVKIDQMELVRPHYRAKMKKHIFQIIERHHITTIKALINPMSPDNLKKFVETISKCALIILIGVDHNAAMLSEESKKYWKSFAKTIIDESRVAAVKLMSGFHLVCLQIESFYNFMLYF